MAKQLYISKKFAAKSLDFIETANAIIAEYQGQGYDLTLRQLYYQMVARDIIPNNVKSYNNLGSLISDARLAGLIDWLAIVDRTRNLRANGHWDSPAAIVKACAQQFEIDKWADQPYRIECWVEKDALVGVLERVCTELDVPYFACRGYTSQSEMWLAGQRFQRYVRDGQTPLILHLGDHDPSGIDMTRDIFDRLELFMGGLKVERLALNFDQVEEHNPPPNPAKMTDSRAESYVARFGDESWELDALDPKTISGLISDAVFEYRDVDLWDEAVSREREMRARLEKVAKTLQRRD